MFFNLKIFVFVLMSFLVGAAICNDPLSNPIYNNECLKNCPVTADYRPFCGSDGQNYPTTGILGCFTKCNIHITKDYDGQCKN